MLKRCAATTMALAWGGILLAGCTERPTAPVGTTGPMAEIGIAGVGPVVDAGIDVQTFTAEQVELKGWVEVPEGSEIASWLWAVVISPEASEWGLTDENAQVAYFRPYDAGDYTLSLGVCVVDAAGGQLCAFDEVKVTAVVNQPPVADAQADPTAALVGEEVCFSGSGSYDPEPGWLSYLWEFGDGATSSEMYACHTYTSAGEYAAKLTVTDDWDLTGKAGITITVSQPGPQAALQSLIDDVQALVSAGTLDPDRAAGLLDKLTAASASVESALMTDACKQLSAFAKQVKASVKARKLSATVGQDLIDAAEAIGEQIGCG